LQSKNEFMINKLPATISSTVFVGSSAGFTASMMEGEAKTGPKQ
jgi:hypothetical protein